MKISPKQMNVIQDRIELELLKRGFTAKIIRFDHIDGGSTNRFELESESFQTVPVIFESIKIQNFNGSVYDEDGEIRFWITIDVRYTHFGGGSNGCTLFQISGKLDGNNSVHIQIS